MQFNLKWADLKKFATDRSVSIQWVQSNNIYLLAAIDGSLEVTAQIPMINSPPNTSDQYDFETNYKNTSNAPVLPTLTTVTTQFELNNKDLKLARLQITLEESTSGTASLRIPGVFGTTDGRYIAGGYAISADYDLNDYVTVQVNDTDRLIALAIAQSQNPAATEPVADSIVQGLGIIPMIGEAMPNYPLVKSYTDTDVPSENQGWYFWPLMLNSYTAAGECEVEPVGGYGFIPAGLYITMGYYRQTLTTGTCNINFWWGKLE